MQMIDPLSWVMSGVCDSSLLTNYDAHCSQSPRATLHTTPPLGRKRAMQIDDILSCRVVSGRDLAVGTWAIRDVAG
jgi:hypothetical protein